MIRPFLVKLLTRKVILIIICRFGAAFSNKNADLEREKFEKWLYLPNIALNILIVYCNGTTDKQSEGYVSQEASCDE